MDSPIYGTDEGRYAETLLGVEARILPTPYG